MVIFSETIIPVDNVRATTGGESRISRIIVACPSSSRFEVAARSQLPSESESVDSRRKTRCFLNQDADIHMK